MKKSLLFLLGLLPFISNSQNSCSLNPNLIGQGLTVSGQFFDNDAYSRKSIAYFTRTGNIFFPNQVVLKVHEYPYGGLETVWLNNNFDLEKIRYRVVSGDFDQDGLEDDIAAIYDASAGNSSIKLWLFNNGTQEFEHYTVWNTSGYTASMTTGRVVSGDFDSDGFIDDIAAFYDYGSSNTKIHVWKMNAHLSPTYQWWFETSGYSAPQTSYRVVSGDFDRDGTMDDIAAFYDYGGGAMRIHVFKGMNSYFNYTTDLGWWSTPSGYTPNNINLRIVAGNFDKSGVFNHKSDDIIAFYDYGSSNVKAHAWTSTGSSFNYSWKWETSGFDASQITGRVVPLNLSNSDFNTDRSEKWWYIGAIYNYGSITEDFYSWEADGSPWNLNSSLISFCSTRAADVSNGENSLSANLTIYPNPTSNTTFVSGLTSNSTLSLYSMDGKKILTKNISLTSEPASVSLNDVTPGIYLMIIAEENGKNHQSKIVVE